MAFILLLFLCLRIYLRAKHHGQPPGKWVIYNILSVVAAWFIGAMISSIIFMIKDPGLRKMMTQTQPDQQAVMQYFASQDMFFPELFILFCGIGGYLFIRHRLIRKIMSQNNPG